MRKLKKYLKEILKPNEKELLKVYSHPRSGTHFLEAFLSENFYHGKDLSIPNITWGHWSNRQVKPAGNPYGQLFGNHYLADRNINNKPKIYIVRDGRAVAYSIWKTPSFLHKEISELTFKAFLRTPIDWYGTPSIKAESNLTILDHWVHHVKSWYELAKKDTNVLIIKYEDLINDPYKQYLIIHNKYFNSTKKLETEQINKILIPVGLLPNKAKIDAWKPFFDKEDLYYYSELIKNNNIEI